MVINVLRLPLFILLLQLSTLLFAQQAVPSLQSRVNDLTHTLSVSETKTLETDLATYESQKGAQIAILMVPTTAPETIEEYGIRVADAWKIGRKGIDDGVILLIAKDDRRLRIEVGYGLEGAIPDAIAKRIISEYITPQFKNDRYYAGISSGVEQIKKRINGEPLPPTLQRGKQQGKDELSGFIFPGIIAIVAVGGILRRIFGRLLGAIATGGLVALLAWFFAGFLIAFVAGIFGFILSLMGGGMIGSGLMHAGGFRGGGGFGGFGGGGGGFGGGGSSGRW